ncbi:MAG: hypothetical protein ACR2GA_03535 [Chloroflexota bacterium]
MSVHNPTNLWALSAALILTVLAFVPRAALVGADDPAIAVSVMPANAGLNAARMVQATNMPVNAIERALVFDPSGGQTALFAGSDASGSLSLRLEPPSGGWMPGVYRLVLATSVGDAVSVPFVAGTSGPQLLEQPDFPSPTSALHFVGSGLAADTVYDLQVTLANGRGERDVSAISDGSGIISAYLWPQQIPAPFFEAGPYRVSLPVAGLTTNFSVRERPLSANLTCDASVVAGQSLAVHLVDYPAQRYVWAVYADANGRQAGELLLGQTDKLGTLDSTVHLPDNLPSGAYLLATPYDWGETGFTVTAPIPIPTDTPPANSTSTQTT